MQYNLQLMDAELPNLVSKMLLNFYLNRTVSISDNIEEIYNGNDGFSENIIDKNGYKIKLKRFLVAILLGVFSGKKWDGKFTSNGTIIVKQDGSQVAFHVVNLGILEEYLFNEIKFDTPSTTRHRFACVYKERDGKYYFKLNLQLRF